MTKIFLLSILTTILTLSCNQNSNSNKIKQPNQELINYSSMTYKDALLSTKNYYPFDNWRELYKPNPEEDFDGMEQYSPENCNSAQGVFDKLIDGLIKLDQGADEKQKVELFKIAILQLNDLNEKIEGLIETGEREDLCELVDQITIAAGLNPKDYGDGEGISDIWRNW